MILGFTGSRAGITPAQRTTLLRLFERLGYCEFHHGDCVGADAAAHSLALLPAFRFHIIIHPPISPRLRAMCEGAAKVLTPKPYIQRNRDIVDACDHLLVCPNGEETIRSGTWATVRYARKRKRDYSIIHPAGITTETLFGKAH